MVVWSGRGESAAKARGAATWEARLQHEGWMGVSVIVHRTLLCTRAAV
jgi:hypothetical protein